MNTMKKTRHFSPITMAFRKLSRQDKHNKVLSFCIEHNRTPSTSNVTDEERVIGQFYTNSKSAYKNGRLPKWEMKLIDKANKYSHTHKTITQRINEILIFCKSYNRTPIQSSNDKKEKKLAQSLNTIKNKAKHNLLTKDELKVLYKTHDYRSNYQRSREEKLQDVLDYCIKHNRTPRQHAIDKNEKRLAEFLSSLKVLYKRDELNNSCIQFINKIKKYSPPNREQKLKELLKFIKTYKRAPNLTGTIPNENKLFAFFTKMKSYAKCNKLNETELNILNKIITTCKIKTRLDKIKELHDFTKKHKRIPKLSGNESERKLATFYNNIRQSLKKNLLKKEEVLLMNEYTNLISVMSNG